MIGEQNWYDEKDVPWGAAVVPDWWKEVTPHKLLDGGFSPNRSSPGFDPRLAAQERARMKTPDQDWMIKRRQREAELMAKAEAEAKEREALEAANPTTSPTSPIDPTLFSLSKRASMVRGAKRGKSEEIPEWKKALLNRPAYEGPKWKPPPKDDSDEDGYDATKQKSTYDGPRWKPPPKDDDSDDDGYDATKQQSTYDGPRWKPPPKDDDSEDDYDATKQQSTYDGPRWQPPPKDDSDDYDYDATKQQSTYDGPRWQPPPKDDDNSEEEEEPPVNEVAAEAETATEPETSITEAVAAASDIMSSTEDQLGKQEEEEEATNQDKDIAAREEEAKATSEKEKAEAEEAANKEEASPKKKGMLDSSSSSSSSDDDSSDGESSWDIRQREREEAVKRGKEEAEAEAKAEAKAEAERRKKAEEEEEEARKAEEEWIKAQKPYQQQQEEAKKIEAKKKKKKKRSSSTKEKVEEEEEKEEEVDEETMKLRSQELVIELMEISSNANKAKKLKQMISPTHENGYKVRVPTGELLLAIAYHAKNWRDEGPQSPKIGKLRVVAVVARLVILKLYGDNSPQLIHFQEGLRPAFANPDAEAAAVARRRASAIASKRDSLSASSSSSEDSKEEEKVEEHDDDHVVDRAEAMKILSQELVVKLMDMRGTADRAKELKNTIGATDENGHKVIVPPEELLDAIANYAQNWKTQQPDKIGALRQVAVVARLVIIKLYGQGSQELTTFQEGLRPAFA